MSSEKNTEFKLPVKRVEGETLKERLTENAYNKILPARYLLKDGNGKTDENPEDLFERVAKNVAKPEKKYDDVSYEEAKEEFEEMLTNLEFMPNSPTLMNAGADLQQLAACFVVHPEDDMDSIFNKVHHAAKVFQTGGGMGYPFHLLRPKGDKISSTGGIASGPLSFQRIFDTMCSTIKQGGKRRGAQMGIMRVDHPDILRFIVAKRKEGTLSNFNLSVGITDEFMQAVKNDESYTLINPRTEQGFEVIKQTAEFYNKDEDWYPEAVGSDTDKDDNFWRDFASTFSEEVNQFDINLEPGEKMELPARFIWEALIDSAWRNGEPGLYMYDEANKMHSFDVEKHPEHKMESTNPCVTGETLINTNQGIYTAEELSKQRIATDVVADSRRSNQKIKEASSIYKTGTKDVLKLKTQEGFELRLTEDHQVMTEDGWKEARKLKKGETVHILDREGSFGDQGTEEEGQVLGWLVGDGQMKQSEERAVLHFYDQDTDIAEDFAKNVNQVIRTPDGNANYEVGVQKIKRREGHRQTAEAKEQRVRSSRLYELAEEYSLDEEKLQVPEKVFRSSRELAIGFLQGLFTADGSVQGNVEKGVSVRLSSSEKELLKETQRLLLNFGIYSKLYTERREEGSREMPNGKGGIKEYDTKAQHELMISKGSLIKFQQKIGFLREEKNRKLKEKISNYTRGPYKQKFTATFESLEQDGHEDVYDLTEPDTHSFIANGLVVHNCGEQPLEKYEACNLGHINLSLLVEDKSDGMGLNFQKWRKDHEDEYNFESEEGLNKAMKDYIPEALDMEHFEHVAKTGMQFLDNVVTMSDFPLDEIKEKVSSMRKVGLGLMGFAQMLVQLGIKYGSDASVAAAKEIQRIITRFSIEESNRLAQVRGKFPDWNQSKWASPTDYPDWFRKYTGGLEPENYKDGLELRNHNATTIAPTGSTSMIANTTGGCEPIYSLAYFKNVASDVQGENMLVEFDDYFLKALKANDVDVEKVKERATKLMKNNNWDGIDSISDQVLPPEIKNLFATTETIEPEEHVKIQAAFQEHNHSAISKTCNFKNDSTRDDIREAYELAYDLNVKGLTVYRDGSRDVQVMTTRKENKLDDKEDLLKALFEKHGSLKDILESEEFERALENEGNLELKIKKNESNITVSQASQPQRQDRERRNRPSIINGTTQKIETGQGPMFVTINEDSEGLFEVFASIGKSGGFTASFTEALGRLVSLALRSGIAPEQIIDELKGIRSPKVSWDNGTKIHSIPDGIAKAMERYLEGEAKNVQENVMSFSENEDENKKESKSGENQVKEMIERGINPECPECGSILEYSEGCVKCPACGWSEC